MARRAEQGRFRRGRCLHGSAGRVAAPTCSGVQINRTAADAWTHATLVYLTEGCWCESRQRNKRAIHKTGHVIQRRVPSERRGAWTNGAEDAAATVDAGHSVRAPFGMFQHDWRSSGGLDSAGDDEVGRRFEGCHDVKASPGRR